LLLLTLLPSTLSLASKLVGAAAGDPRAAGGGVGAAEVGPAVIVDMVDKLFLLIGLEVEEETSVVTVTGLPPTLDVTSARVTRA